MLKLITIQTLLIFHRIKLHKLFPIPAIFRSPPMKCWHFHRSRSREDGLIFTPDNVELLQFQKFIKKRIWSTEMFTSPG